VLDFIWDPPERNPGKPLKWIVLDSLIIAGIAFGKSKIELKAELAPFSKVIFPLNDLQENLK